MDDVGLLRDSREFDLDRAELDVPGQLPGGVPHDVGQARGTLQRVQSLADVLEIAVQLASGLVGHQPQALGVSGERSRARGVTELAQIHGLDRAIGAPEILQHGSDHLLRRPGAEPPGRVYLPDLARLQGVVRGQYPLRHVIGEDQ